MPSDIPHPILASSAHTAATKRAPIVSMVPLRPVTKRSHSPAPSFAGCEHKRVKAENGGHRQPLPPPNCQPRKNNQNNWKHQNHPKYNQNQNPNRESLGLNNPPPIPSRQSLRLRNLPPTPNVGRDTTSKKLQSPGSIFVPSGNVYITRNCKRLTLESGRTLWKVNHPNRKGIQVPFDVYQAVLGNERATREMRKAAVDKVDKKEKEEARGCLLKMFPSLPPGEDDVILGRAWERSSGRVGRSSKLSLENKVRMAVVAHVRHAHSNYGQRLREEFKKNGRQGVAENIRQKVRNETQKEVNAVISNWNRRGATSVFKPPQADNSGNRRGATSVVKPPQTDKLASNAEKKPKNGRTKEQKRLKRERKKQRRRNETEEQKKARSERWEIKRRKKQERKLSKQASERAERESREKDTKGKGKSEAIEFIIIGSDSEDDTIPNEKSSDNDDDNPNKSIRLIGPQESDSEEEGAENAEDWDIGEEDDDDDDFFYADDTQDEDYTDFENIDDVYPRKTRTRLSVAAEKDEEVMEEEGNKEDTGVEEERVREEGNKKDAGVEGERVWKEETGQVQLVKNEDEIELDFGDIESTYQDLLLFNSRSNARATIAEMVISQQAGAENQREEKPVVELNIHSTVARNKDATETPHEHSHSQLEKPVSQHQIEFQTEGETEKDIDHEEEKKFKTEVEEAEEELYRDFGFDEEDQAPSFDGFETMEIEVENKSVEIVGEAKMVKVELEDEVEGKRVEVEPEDKVDEKREENLGTKPKGEPERRPEDNQKVEPEAEPEVELEKATSEVNPESGSDEEFIKKEYHVGGYIVEEFVRVKRVKAEVVKESVKRKRLRQASESEKDTKFVSSTSK